MRIERLLKERKEKAREFAEAQDLSSKLMAVMGFKTEQSVPLPSNTVNSDTSDFRRHTNWPASYPPGENYSLHSIIRIQHVE
jgi:hypothetical protein